MDPSHIRNFCIIAHIDHGKSTLADRLLEATGTVDARHMTAQFLDSMDLERERGITIKGKAVRMDYRHTDGQHYQLNLIDTPGHVDFSYEVSRALAACEGAVLVVDASQGIQAQTLANAYLAVGHDLTLIPLLNKIDLPGAEPQRVSQEIEQVFGFPQNEQIFASAKQGIGITQLLTDIVEKFPSPQGVNSAPLQALIFDSYYDSYKGVVALVRVFAGSVRSGQRLLMIGSNIASEAVEIGCFLPHPHASPVLSAGEVGYIATGLKNVQECRVGDTITLLDRQAYSPLPGYAPHKAMVFAGLYPAEGESYENMREALEKLRLNDAALTYEPETSPALGFGYRCGFLGLLHMEIVQERLEREYNLNVIATAPSVGYLVVHTNGRETLVANPSEMPPAGEVSEVKEPWLDVTILAPSRYIGPIMDLATSHRGAYKRMEYISSAVQNSETGNPASDARVLLQYDIPLGEVLADFYNQLKSRTQGYASLDYSFSGYRAGPLVKLDVLLNGETVDALCFIVHREKAYQLGRDLVERLRRLIPRQMYEVAIQAAIGSRIIARESVRALRKDVLAKCYGGDITRKRKLLEKQAEGKKRLKRVGQVEIPQEAFLALMTHTGK